MTPLSLNYDFFAPPQIIFGWGRRSEAGAVAASIGRRAFIVSGSRTLEANGALDQLRDALAAANVHSEPLGNIAREPQVDDVDRFTERLCHLGPGEGDFVLGIGGGSAIDLAKAIAAMATNRRSNTVRDYLEGIGSGLGIAIRPLPVLAVPTTAGTGSEATKNAVIASADPPVKKSLRSDFLVPRAVLVDPELSVSLSPQTTAYSGMDAITQCVESFISRRARPIPCALAIEGLRLASPAIEEAVHDGTSRRAREAMAHAALLSGMSLANSGLGMAHGVAAALGTLCDVPHGLACAVMLPAALRANRNIALARLAVLARATSDIVYDDDATAADAFITRIESISRGIGIPKRLSEIGVMPHQLPALVSGSQGNSMNGNPREIGEAELQQMLEAML